MMKEKTKTSREDGKLTLLFQYHRCVIISIETIFILFGNVMPKLPYAKKCHYAEIAMSVQKNYVQFV